MPTSLPPLLLACDLDGTLLERGASNPADLAALRRAQDAGIHIAIATGRNAVESAKYIDQLHLTGPGVFVDGGTVCDQATGKTLISQAMPIALVDEIIDFFGALGHAVLALADDPVTALPAYILSEHAVPHRATVEWLRLNKMAAAVASDIEPGLKSRVVRLSIVVDVPEAADIERQLAARFGSRIFSYSIFAVVFNCQVIEVFNPNVTKWTGIVKVCDLLGIDPRRTVAVGDDVNDLPMLRNAELSFAMGNAPPAVQAAAKRVTLKQSECGVAQVVEWILGGK